MGFISEGRQEEFEAEALYLVDETAFERQREADLAYYRKMGAAFQSAKAKLEAEAAVHWPDYMVIKTPVKEEA